METAGLTLTELTWNLRHLQRLGLWDWEHKQNTTAETDIHAVKVQWK